MIIKRTIVFILMAFLGQTAAQEESSSIFDKIKAKQATQSSSAPLSLTKEELAFKQQLDDELSAYTVKYLKEFAEYKSQYNSELAAYRSEILAKWGEVDVSSNTKVVDYGEENVKTVVDFDKQEVVVSIIHDKDEVPDVKKVERAVSRLRNLTPDKNVVKQGPDKGVNVLEELVDDEQAKSIIDDTASAVANASKEEVRPTIDKQDVKAEQDKIARIREQDKQQIEIIADKANISDEQVAEVQSSLVKRTPINVIKINDASTLRKQEKLKEKRITRYKIAVTGKSDINRVKKVKPFADENASKWALPLELVIAIIHTESSFNPMAVSQIPAYGLMQIVPTSAGVDVNEFLNSKREPMQTEILFQSELNIQAGTAYLHILNGRYLKKIDDDVSRLYCVIAAYNTGVGNVARAFANGKYRRLSSAVLSEINGMSSDQVYQQLIEKLPYEETRKYLDKVRNRMVKYEKILQSMKQNSA